MFSVTANSSNHSINYTHVHDFLSVHYYNLKTLFQNNAQLTSSKEVESRVSSQNPEAVVFSSEGLYSCPLGHLPHTDTLVLRVTEDELLARMEQHT